MKSLVIANLLVLLVLGTASAQSQTDVCHVYVLDVAKARRAAESFTEPATQRPMRKPFPWAKLSSRSFLQSWGKKNSQQRAIGSRALD
jgi:hypothetical protein